MSSNQPEPSRADLAESMPAQANEFVQACKAKGVSLDYQLRTLPLVDKFISGVRAEVQQLTVKKDPQAAELVTKHVGPVTAYLGEVIRRETGGNWYDFDGRPMIETGEHQADPQPIVEGLLEHGRAQEGDVDVQSLKAYCDMVCRMQRVWLDGTVLGTYESMTTLRTSITPDAKLAGTIVAQSQAAVKTGKLTFGEALDFSSESLEGVERIMNKLHKQATEAPADQKLTEAQIIELSKLWGIYVGEVIRRYYGGQWAMVDGVPDLALGGKQSSPLAKVRKRIVDGPMENLKYFFQSIMKQLSSQKS
jgi:hypothetical protein